MSFSKLNHSMSWAGRTYRPNSLTTRGRFNPRVPSVSEDKNAEDELIWYDVPKKLKERLDKKSQKITVDCIKENAESILRFYESDVVEHVLEMQMHNKAVRSLVMRDHEEEQKNPKDYVNEAARKLAKSSYLGSDPFGDKKLDDTLFDEFVDDPLDPSTKRYELSAKGSLLKSIQDMCHRYARVHLQRVLSKNIKERVRDMERKDAATPSRLNNFHNKRRSWSTYREKVIEDLLSDSGLHVLGIILSLERESGDTAARWVQRLSIGRQMLATKMGTNLSDQVYVELATRQLTDLEQVDMARILLNKDVSLTPARAKAQIKLKGWVDFEHLVRKCVAQEKDYQHGDARVPYEERVFTLEQARHLPPKKKPRKTENANKQGKEGKGGGGKPRRKDWIECSKCKAAGITKMRHLNHLAKDCKKELREKRAKEVRERAKKARDGKAGKERKANSRQQQGDGGGRGNGREQRGEIPQCSDCKQAGRPHIGHVKADCLYKKGGPWHGLKGDALRQAKRKRYEETREQRQRKRQSRTVTKSTVQRESEGEQSSEGPAWWLGRSELRRRSRFEVEGLNSSETATTASSEDSESWLSEERDEDAINMSFLRSNLELLRTIAAPRNKAETRSMLEVFDTLKDGVDHYAHKAEPLRKLLQEHEGFAWTSRCESSFQVLRASLLRRLTDKGAEESRKRRGEPKTKKAPRESEGDQVRVNLPSAPERDQSALANDRESEKHRHAMSAHTSKAQAKRSIGWQTATGLLRFGTWKECRHGASCHCPKSRLTHRDREKVEARRRARQTIERAKWTQRVVPAFPRMRQRTFKTRPGIVITRPTRGGEKEHGGKIRITEPANSAARKRPLRDGESGNKRKARESKSDGEAPARPQPPNDVSETAHEESGAAGGAGGDSGSEGGDENNHVADLFASEEDSTSESEEGAEVNENCAPAEPESEDGESERATVPLPTADTHSPEFGTQEEVPIRKSNFWKSMKSNARKDPKWAVAFG